MPERTNSGNCIQNLLLSLNPPFLRECALEIDKVRMSGDTGAFSIRFKVEDRDIARTGTRRRKAERLHLPQPPENVLEYTIATGYFRGAGRELACVPL